MSDCFATHGGKTVWIRGQCPQNLNDAVNLDSHDPVAQTHKVMQNIKQLIEEAGGEMAQGNLGERLIAAMRAGLAAGGEAGPVHLAGLLLVDKVSWLVAEMRCEWAQVCPIETIATAWDTYKPQLDDYVRLELGPSQAPSYGVPGDR